MWRRRLAQLSITFPCSHFFVRKKKQKRKRLNVAKKTKQNRPRLQTDYQVSILFFEKFGGPKGTCRRPEGSSAEHNRLSRSDVLEVKLFRLWYCMQKLCWVLEKCFNLLAESIQPSLQQIKFCLWCFKLLQHPRKMLQLFIWQLFQRLASECVKQRKIKIYKNQHGSFRFVVITVSFLITVLTSEGNPVSAMVATFFYHTYNIYQYQLHLHSILGSDNIFLKNLFWYIMRKTFSTQHQARLNPSKISFTCPHLCITSEKKSLKWIRIQFFAFIY